MIKPEDNPFRFEEEVCFATKFNWAGEAVHCRILNYKGGCIGKQCSSYRTKEEKKAEEKSAMERIRSLPIEQQKKIADKYYFGVFKWNNAKYL